MNWSEHPEVNVEFQLPAGVLQDLPSRGIPWEDYKRWDLKGLTRNYLQLYVDLVRSKNEGASGPAL